MREYVSPRNVIIDTDMGWDDILAIALLMKDPRVNIVGVTVTGCGETHLDDGVAIAQGLLALGNNPAPVCRGAFEPSQYDHQFPASFRQGMDDASGLRDTLPPPLAPVDPRTAWDFMADQLGTQGNQITILSLGGLTNIARLLEMQPTPALANIDRIVIMGGAVNVDGNVASLNNALPEWNQGPVYGTNHYAEWNIFIDPLAAKTVLRSGLPITMVPLDACDDVLLTSDYAKVCTAPDPLAQWIGEMLNQKLGPNAEPTPLPIFDPLAALVAACELRDIRTETVRLDVVTEDTVTDNTCGQTLAVHDEKVPVCRVVTAASAVEFRRVFSDLINGPLPPAPNAAIRKNVGILLFDQVEIQDWAGPYEALASARNPDGSAAFNVFTVADNAEPKLSNAGEPPKVGTQSGMKISPDYTFDNHPPIDVLMVVGGQGIDAAVADEHILAWIKATAKQATYVAGICSGVLLLAHARLLDGLTVTTHHTRFTQLQELSDEQGMNLQVLDTRNGRNFIHDPSSKVMTSGGVHCGIALGVHIVQMLMGESAKDYVTDDVMEYTQPWGRNGTPPGFPLPRRMDPRDFVLGISHLNVIMRDMDMIDEAEEFYSRVLGFERAWSTWLSPECCEHFAKDAGLDGECRVLVRFLRHPNAMFHIELMMYETPKGDPDVIYRKTNDVGGIRHVAVEVTDAVAAFEWLARQDGVRMIKPIADGYGPPEKLLPDPQTFFYWLDPYGVQWEFEQGRPMARVVSGIVG